MPYKYKFKYGQLSNSILESIADFLIKDGSSGLKPDLPYLLGLLIKMVRVSNNNKIDNDRVSRCIKSLERRNIIKLKRINDKVYVLLEEKGIKKVIKYSFTRILQYKQQQKKWNGKWFMVFFDIPESQRNKRAYLRNFLKSIGFYQYQQSVYLYPYPCPQEIDYLRKIIEVTKYTKYIVVDKIEDEEEIKSFFNID